MLSTPRLSTSVKCEVWRAPLLPSILHHPQQSLPASLRTTLSGTAYPPHPRMMLSVSALHVVHPEALYLYQVWCDLPTPSILHRPQQSLPTSLRMTLSGTAYPPRPGTMLSVSALHIHTEALYLCRVRCTPPPPPSIFHCPQQSLPTSLRTTLSGTAYPPRPRTMLSVSAQHVVHPEALYLCQA